MKTRYSNVFHNQISSTLGLRVIKKKKKKKKKN